MPECRGVIRIALVTAVCLLTGACSGVPATPVADTRQLVERARLSMGSEVRLTAWTADERNALAAFEHIFDDFDYLDRLLSVWHPESAVSRINAAAGRAPVVVSGEVIEVLQTARQVSEWTTGKFDITFGALSGLWKFDHDQDNKVPRPRDVSALLPLVDYRAVEVDTRAGTVSLGRGMRIHLGGIGKGFAVDRAAALFRSHGIGDFMIQTGGDLYASGRRGDRPWRAGIRDPRGPADRIFAALELNDETFSTSGDYERFFVKDGRRYHHILDPDSGQPAAGSRSVTIVAARAMLADALATGVFIMGPDAGMSLIERLPDVEGVIVGANNEVLVSSGLRGRLQTLASPTDAP
jgi:thiamine biosynthesis lipoprotein